MQGKDKDPVVQSSLSELIVYQEMIRMGLDYACEHYETSQPSGMVFPTTLAVNATKYYLAANFPQTLKYLQDRTSGGEGESEAVHLDLGGRRSHKKKYTNN